MKHLTIQEKLESLQKQLDSLIANCGGDKKKLEQLQSTPYVQRLLSELASLKRAQAEGGCDEICPECGEPCVNEQEGHTLHRCENQHTWESSQ